MNGANAYIGAVFYLDVLQVKENIDERFH